MLRTRTAVALVALLLLAACTGSAQDATPTPLPTPEPTPSASPEPTDSAEPTESAEESEPAEPTPSASQFEGAGGFTWEVNAEADALMEETFDCQNLDDGYEVDFPAEWNTNAEFGRLPPCSYFAATEYELEDDETTPDEVVIVISLIENGPYHYGSGEVLDREEGIVGATQPASRVTWTYEGETIYQYEIQLGRTIEEGPILIAGTSDGQDGDFDLNRAVLDRMVATMEFIGVIQ